MTVIGLIHIAKSCSYFLSISRALIAFSLLSIIYMTNGIKKDIISRHIILDKNLSSKYNQGRKYYRNKFCLKKDLISLKIFNSPLLRYGSKQYSCLINIFSNKPIKNNFLLFLNPK